MTNKVLLGDEAVALGAVHAGLAAGYAYPGTPSTAGSIRATNMVMVGASSRLLPIKPEMIEQFIKKTFVEKGERVVESNLKAFRAGREAASVD